MNRKTLAAVALLSVPAFVACGQAAEEAIEQGIEQGTGTDVEIDGDSVTATDDEGNSLSAGDDVSLPASWPSTLPEPDGTLVFAAGSAADGTASGIWEVQGSAGEALASYSSALTSAGFTEQQVIDIGSGKTATFSGSGLSVAVIAADGESGTSLNVSVVPES